MNTPLVLIAVCGLAVATPGLAHAKKGPPKPEPRVTLSIESPKVNPKLPLPILYSSGWQLEFKAEARSDALGVGVTSAPSDYPGGSAIGYVVFEDPDGCLALPPPFVYFAPIPNDDGTYPGENPCNGKTQADSDEVYMQFANDVDMAGVQDLTGDPAVQAALADPVQSGPAEFTGVLLATGQLGSVALGPFAGMSADDGYGYGADDDFASLVVLSDTGPGLVFNDNFDLVSPRQQRNLAGFLNSVAYSLRESTGLTTVYASMVVPYGLVAAFMAADDCVGDPSLCNATSVNPDPPRFRLDGGTVTDSLEGLSYSNYPALYDASAFEIRAFVVSGVAPAVLVDSDGDGDVDALDAELAGYTVLSNEVSGNFRQYHDQFCAVGLGNVVYRDLDGNGAATVGPVCPAGPGRIKGLPD